MKATEETTMKDIYSESALEEVVLKIFHCSL